MTSGSQNQIIRFLGEGHKVRHDFSSRREMAHRVGRAKMTRLWRNRRTLPDRDDAGMEGNVLVALLAPKKVLGVARAAAPAQTNA